MKCAVIYFSATSNTEKVAKAIGAGIKQAAGHCDVVKIKDAHPRRLWEYDLIGIGCPVYGFVETLNVRAFIKDMRFVGGKHAFAFCTHGTVGEYFFPSIVPRMRNRGMVVIGMWDCYGTVYMGGSGENSPTGGHPDEIDLKEAEEFGREMVERSQRISAGEKGLIPSYPKYAKFHANKYIRDRQKREVELGMPANVAVRQRPQNKVDKEKCNYPKCRLCMVHCPMDGIDLTVEPPVIAKPCIGCGMCELICPTGAMYREGFGGFAAPEEARKAVHEEFYANPLAQAEAEGRFRRLVTVKGDFGGPPPRKPSDKHPRWIIGKGPQ